MQSRNKPLVYGYLIFDKEDTVPGQGREVVPGQLDVYIGKSSTGGWGDRSGGKEHAEQDHSSIPKTHICTSTHSNMHTHVHMYNTHITPHIQTCIPHAHTPYTHKHTLITLTSTSAHTIHRNLFSIGHSPKCL